MLMAAVPADNLDVGGLNPDALQAGLGVVVVPAMHPQLEVTMLVNVPHAEADTEALEEDALGVQPVRGAGKRHNIGWDRRDTDAIPDPDHGRRLCLASVFDQILDVAH